MRPQQECCSVVFVAVKLLVVPFGQSCNEASKTQQNLRGVQEMCTRWRANAAIILEAYIP